SVIDGFFRLVMRENSGAAFSIAEGKTVMLVSVSVIALIVVLGLFFFGRIRGKLMNIGLALFTAGIIGNLYDRAFNHGYVRDFLDVYYKEHHWPAFNVADSMLCVAVGLLVIANIMADISQRRDDRQTEEL
ncbi:MAG: signal peptidase II, partial [Planctomycetes bacterium]|nr:signal peptidase II [Planctomycetota bacterium]